MLNINIMSQKQKSLIIYSIPLALLMLPLIGTQFSKEVNWSGFDFLVAGVLLFGTAIIVDTILKKVKSKSQRILFVLFALLVLFLIWAELSVGVFGTPFAGS